MPYYVYRILEKDDKKELEHLQTHEKYREAREQVRDKRQNRESGDEADYRMIFAKNQTEAETLLKAPREGRVIGED